MCHFKNWAEEPKELGSEIVKGPRKRGLVGLSEVGREQGLKSSVLCKRDLWMKLSLASLDLTGSHGAQTQVLPLNLGWVLG